MEHCPMLLAGVLWGPWHPGDCDLWLPQWSGESFPV